ncbi:6-phosphogluconolactonase [Planctomycetota bacterium]
MNASTSNPPHIEIASDSESLADKVLDLFVESAVAEIAAKGAFYVAVSGGRTPKQFFERLGASPAAQQIEWHKVHLFWTDERYVPADSEASNYKLVADAFLAHVDLPDANVHRIPTEFDNMFDAIHAYEQTLREVFGITDEQTPTFDLVLLGMGADGHTASLFPNTYAPFDTEDWVCAVYKGGGGRQPYYPHPSRPARRLQTRGCGQR